MSEHKELIRRLAMMLDGALVLMDKEAAAEKRREAGKTLRQITAQERAKHARKLLDEAASALEAMC